MTGLPAVMVIGLLGWLISTTIIVVVIAVRANNGVISIKLADRAIFETIMAGFYSAVYGLFGSIYGALVGLMAGALAGGVDNILPGTVYGAVVGANFGPMFVIYVIFIITGGESGNKT